MRFGVLQLLRRDGRDRLRSHRARPAESRHTPKRSTRRCSARRDRDRARSSRAHATRNIAARVDDGIPMAPLERCTSPLRSPLSFSTRARDRRRDAAGERRHSMIRAPAPLRRALRPRKIVPPMIRIFTPAILVVPVPYPQGATHESGEWPLAVLMYSS